MLTVYGMRSSGNCYKLQLLLEQLGRAYRWIDVDSVQGDTRTPEYLAKNPNGKVPLLELADGRRLAESNAILCYLADGSSFFPADPWQRALTLQWLFFEQYSHEPCIAVARFILVYLPPEHSRRLELPRLQKRGNRVLGVMESHLREHDWFTPGRYGIADIALYAYTHCAADGGFDLAVYPLITGWLARVMAQPEHSPLQR